MKLPQAKLNFIDRVKSYFSPKAAVEIAKTRMTMDAFQQMGYLIPGSPKKTMKGVAASANSPTTDISGKLEGSRAISRDMAMNSPLAIGTIDRLKTNVVGGGLIPQITPNYEILGITQEQAKKWSNALEFRFDTWAGSKCSDFNGYLDFYGMQQMAFASMVLNGDMFFITPWTTKGKPKNWPWNLSIKLIEADLVDTPETGEYLQKDIVNGIEHKDGRRVAVHVRGYYKDEFYSERLKTNQPEFIRFPIYDRNGRQNIYQVTLTGHRIGQRRGIGLLAPVVDLLKTMSRYTEAFLVGELVSSLFTVFIKDANNNGVGLLEGYTRDDLGNMGGGTDVDSDGNYTPAPNEDSPLDLNMGSGNVLELPEGMDVSFADPKRDTAAFEPFMDALCTQLGAGVGISSEELLMKFNTSYTAAKAAIQETWKRVRADRLQFSRAFCQPVLEAFAEEEVAKGRIKAKGFLEDPVMRAAWMQCSWIGPGMGQINPVHETKSAVMKVQNNLSTHEEEYTVDKGRRWDKAMAVRAEEKKLLQKYGLYNLTEADLEEVSGPTGTSVTKSKDIQDREQRIEEDSQK